MREKQVCETYTVRIHDEVVLLSWPGQMVSSMAAGMLNRTPQDVGISMRLLHLQVSSGRPVVFCMALDYRRPAIN